VVDESSGRGPNGKSKNGDAPDEQTGDTEGEMANLVKIDEEKWEGQPAADRRHEARPQEDPQGPGEAIRGHAVILAPLAHDP